MSTSLVVLSVAYMPVLDVRSAAGQHSSSLATRRCAAPRTQQRQVAISTEKLRLDDDQVEQLFAWLNMAFSGEPRYNDLMLAFACIFGDHPTGSPYTSLIADALARQPDEEERVGEPTALRQRERGSLGAMGAGQWTGQFRTRPHALLDVRGLGSIEEWEKGLPRGCRRTLARSMKQSFSVEGRPIRGGEPAPHSTLAHFRCVAEHEVRLLADSPSDVLDALSQEFH